MDIKDIAKGWKGNVDFSQDGKGFVFLHLDLSSRNIGDISNFTTLSHVRFLNLSNNMLADLTELGKLPFLTELNVSHNCLERLFGFKAPLLLGKADFSYNYISCLPDLSDFWTLEELNLAHNQIHIIEGLSNLRYLRYLDVSYNNVVQIYQMGCQELHTLNLSHNQLQGPLKGLEMLHKLYNLDLSHNKISLLNSVTKLHQLRALNLLGNNVEDLNELKNLQTLQHLLDLNLISTPLSEISDYRLLIAFMLHSVTNLDNSPITQSEKVISSLTLKPPVKYLAVRNHTHQLLMQLRHPLHITSDILPIGSPPSPILLLVGPSASHKAPLALVLSEQFQGRVLFGPMATTRAARPGEVPQMHYYFVTKEEFDDMEQSGQFLTTFTFVGEHYGLKKKVLEKAASRRMILVANCDLEAALALKMSHPHTKILLVLALNPEIHTSRLRFIINAVMKEKFPDWDALDDANREGMRTKLSTAKDWPGDPGDLNPQPIPLQYLTPRDRKKHRKFMKLCAEATASLESRQEYIQYHHDNPGTFYAVINTDEFETAYQHLKKIVQSIFGSQLTVGKRQKTVLEIEVEKKTKEDLLVQLRMANPIGIPHTPYIEKAFV